MTGMGISSERSSKHAGAGSAIPALIGTIAVVAGVLYAVLALYGAWRSPDAFVRTWSGASVAVELRPGARTVVYEERGRVGTVASLGLAARAPSGREVTLQPYPGVLEYDASDGLGTAVAMFVPVEAGRYAVSSTAAAGHRLAVGPDTAQVAGDGLVTGLAIAALGALAAICVSFVSALRRSC